MRWTPQLKHRTRENVLTFNCYVEAESREEAAEIFAACRLSIPDCYEVTMVCVLPNAPQENP